MEDRAMDRRQMLVQRAREFFGDRLDDVLYLVQKDRQDLRGWQEPAHVRAAARRSVREEGGGETETTRAGTLSPESVRPAAEPDPGRQREAMGQLLEAGAAGLEKLARNTTDLGGEELF